MRPGTQRLCCQSDWRPHLQSCVFIRLYETNAQALRTARIQRHVCSRETQKEIVCTEYGETRTGPKCFTESFGAAVANVIIGKLQLSRMCQIRCARRTELMNFTMQTVGDEGRGADMEDIKNTRLEPFADSACPRGTTSTPLAALDPFFPPLSL